VQHEVLRAVIALLNIGKRIRMPTVTILIAAVAMGMSACNPMVSSVEKARALFEKNDLAAARIEAVTALQKDENDAEAHRLLGAILSAQGDLVTAERTLRRALALGMERSQVDPLLARLLVHTGQFKAVLTEFTPMPAYRGEALGVVHAARGKALLAQRDLDQAQAAFEAALEAFPGLPDALIGQAQLSYMRSDPQAALRLVDHVLNRHPRHPEAWTTKAQLLVLAGKTEGAIAAYDEAAVADPANLPVVLAAAELLMEAKRFDDAKKRIDVVRSRAPDYLPGKYTEAQWHFLRRDYDKALEVAQAARKSAPGFAPLLQLIGMIHLSRGNINQAEEELRAVHLAQPDNAPVRRLYAVTLLRQGKPKAVLDVIAPALEKAPDDAVWLRLAADAHASMRDYARATQALERAALATPENATVQAQLGLLRLAGGDAARGMRELEAAVAASHDSTGPAFGLALLHLERREYDKALDVALGIQTKAPKNPIGFHLAGIALVAAKQTSKAMEAFQHALGLDAAYWPSVKALARIDEVAGNPDRARSWIEAFLARDPSNVEAHYARFHFTGDRGQLLAALGSARRADPKALAPRLMLVRELNTSGLGAEALSIAREAAAIAPNDANAQVALGEAQLAASAASEALATFRRLASERPHWPLAQLRYAQAQAAMGDFSAAQTGFGKILALRPHDPEATVGLARLHVREKREGDAMRLAEALKTHKPKSGVGYSLAGDILLAGGKLADALTAYDAAFARSPSGALLIKRHRVSMQLGRDPGIAPLSAWLERAPRDDEVRLYFGNRLYAQGNYEAAAAQFRKIVDADPKHGYAYNNLASAYLRLNDARALQAAQTAHALLPDDADVLDTLGVALSRTGKAEQGAEMIKKALGRNPQSTEYQVHYAVALAQSGDRESGRAVLRKLGAGGVFPVLDAEQRRVLGMP